jgi:hypothetical protein
MLSALDLGSKQTFLQRRKEYIQMSSQYTKQATSIGTGRESQGPHEKMPCTHLSGYHGKLENNKCQKGCGESGTSYFAGGNVKWCSHYGRQFSGSSKI